MPSLIDKEIVRAIDGKLTAPPAPARRRAIPVVRFSPLFDEAPPAAKRGRRILLAVSVAAHVLLFTVLLLMPRRAQTIEEPSLPMEIVLTAPVPAIPEMARPPALPKPPPPKPKPRPEPKEELPAPVVEIPKPLPKPVIPEVVAAPIVKKIEPPRPRPEVKVGLLDDAPPPAIVASKTSRSTVVVAAGFEGGVAGGTGTSPRQGRVMEAAFDTAPAAAKTQRGTPGAVRDSGFGVEAAPAPKREREQPSNALDTEVEILQKAKPVYTAEARDLRLEGDVVLDVTFEASGNLRVLGVAQGLGHGLDEAAIDAAKKIRFNPAKRDGAPVDHTAKLRVVFRLA